MAGEPLQVPARPITLPQPLQRPVGAPTFRQEGAQWAEVGKQAKANLLDLKTEDGADAAVRARDEVLRGEADVAARGKILDAMARPGQRSEQVGGPVQLTPKGAAALADLKAEVAGNVPFKDAPEIPWALRGERYEERRAFDQTPAGAAELAKLSAEVADENAQSGAVDVDGHKGDSVSAESQPDQLARKHWYPKVFTKAAVRWRRFVETANNRFTRFVTPI